jgi:polygalacturonase
MTDFDVFQMPSVYCFQSQSPAVFENAVGYCNVLNSSTRFRTQFDTFCTVTMLSGTWELDEPQAPDHGYRTGRIKLGTESSGGFKNITVTNCIFEHCRGLALETVDGGHLEDIEISHITMRHIVNAGIFLRLGARMRSPEGTPAGSMKRIRISHINAYDVDSR